jgi:3-oxoacyl-[acyl-carrier-protein] synthase II
LVNKAMIGSNRRVVVTGMGLISPIGSTIEKAWSTLLAGGSGIRLIEDMKYRGLKLHPSCNVSVISAVPEDEFKAHFNDSSRDLAMTTQFALYAAERAISQSDLFKNGTLPSIYQPNRVGVNIGSGGIGPLPDILEGDEKLRESYKKLSPYFVPKVLMNMPASHVSIKYGFKGPIHSVGTACASGVHSIGDAYNFIKWNYADAMITGATEACISPLSISGFARMKAVSLSKSPSSSSRPFDKDRDGFVLGEGAGILVLEELSKAQQRNAPIFAEIVSYAIGGDAYHISSPAPADSGGALRCMRAALDYATVSPSEVGYVNAHATSTPMGDAIESNAIDIAFKSERPLSDPLYVSSHKGNIGHLLGAAGAVETIFTVLSLTHGVIPPTLSLRNPDPAPTSFRHVIDQPVAVPNLNIAVKNSFGFGGMNGVLLLRKNI